MKSLLAWSSVPAYEQRSFFLTLLSSAAWGTSYYVDALNGNDSWNGKTFVVPPTTCTSPCAGPWKTANKVNSSSFAAGDIVGFCSGQRFRGVSNTGNAVLSLNAGFGAGSSTLPIVVTTFGGDAPAWLDGADCLGAVVGNCANWTGTPPTWTLQTGTSIYKTFFQPTSAWPLAIYIDSEQAFPSLLLATCAVGNCVSIPHGGSLIPAGALPVWTGSPIFMDYQINDAVLSQFGQWYIANSAGHGGTQPAYTHGTCTGTASQWTFKGLSAASILTMQPGSWWWDGSSLYIWMPTGDSPANHSIEVVSRNKQFTSMLPHLS